jgi:hypothetical protein
LFISHTAPPTAPPYAEVGYTQGMNFVAGWCLLVLKGDEKSAYWLMSALLEVGLYKFANPVDP